MGVAIGHPVDVRTKTVEWKKKTTDYWNTILYNVFMQ